MNEVESIGRFGVAAIALLITVHTVRQEHNRHHKHIGNIFSTILMINLQQQPFPAKTIVVSSF